MIRTLIRNALLQLLRWIERDPLATAVRRGGGTTIWNKEINIPSSLVALVSMTVFFAVLLFELGGLGQGADYDFMNVSGTAVLGGTLQLRFVNGFASTVTSADTFTILSSSGLSGSFLNVPTTSTRLGTFDGGGSFLVNYVGNSVTLTNFSPIPEPSTYALLALGVGVLAALSRRQAKRRR